MGKLIEFPTSIRKSAVLAGLLLTVTSTFADTANVPNTFVGGTAASADEVNANFSELQGAINGSDTQINNNTAVAQANAAKITALQSARGISVVSDTGNRAGSLLRWDGGSGQADVLSPTGYIATVRTSGVAPVGGMDVFFLTSDCSGQSYMTAGDFHKLQGLVVRTAFADPVTIRYIPKGSVDEVVTTYSQYTNSSCLTNTGTHTMVKAYPNDPAVTGFANTLFDSNLHYFSN